MAELQRGNLAYRYRAGGLHAGHGNGIVFEEIVFKYLRGMSGAHAGGVEKTLQRIRLYMVLRTGRQQCLGRRASARASLTVIKPFIAGSVFSIWARVKVQNLTG